MPDPGWDDPETGLGILRCARCGAPREVVHPDWCDECRTYGPLTDDELSGAFVRLDPHHGHACEWRYVDGHFEHRVVGHKTWVRVRRISVTPARVAMLASLLPPIEWNTVGASRPAERTERSEDGATPTEGR